MFRSIVLLTLIGGALISSRADELVFDFSQSKLGTTPEGFRSTVTGQGEPGQWEVRIEQDEPSDLAGENRSSIATGRTVLAQLSRDFTDEHFPLLVYEKADFADFTFTAKVKTVEGAVEQMAGLAFRILDETNYYAVRISSLGNNFRFYKYVNGIRTAPLGPEVPIEKNTWHEIRVECKGNVIQCSLDGRQLIPELTDNSFNEGKIGFWTKSDAVSYFADAKIVYSPRVKPATKLVEAALERYPRLLGLKLFTTPAKGGELQIVASDDPADIGTPGGDVEKDVIDKNVVYYGKGKTQVLVTLPLHDRNGDPVAAVRVVLKPFPGQTEKNAIVRSMPIVRQMEAEVRSVKDLTR